MSEAAPSSRRGAPPSLRSEAGVESLPRLGYLLKQAHLQFIEQLAEALASLGLGVRDWAALICLDDERGLSQGEVAQQLGIDRTTMVALADTLQHQGLVARQPHPGDRRKNRIALTPEGRSVMEEGARLADEVERQFLAVLSPPDAQQLKGALYAVIAPVSSPE